MFNRLLKSFAIASAFLGLVYVITRESITPVFHRKTSVHQIKPIVSDQATISPTGEIKNEEKIPLCEAPSSKHQCVLEVLPDIAEACLPSIVSINTLQTRKTQRQSATKGSMPGPFGEFFKEFFEGMSPQMPRKIESEGSGFVVRITKGSRPMNAVVTNYHVIKEDSDVGSIVVSILLHDGRKILMRPMAKDPKSDLAVLVAKDAKDQKTLDQMNYLPWADSDLIRTGQKVIALGNPFRLGGTVTDGIISYTKGRDIPSMAESERFVNILPKLIQHSAPINFGSSGGPLVGFFFEEGKWIGKIVGVNTAMLAPAGSHAGVGFAIPSNMARERIEQMIEHGRVLYGWLGVMIEAVDNDKKEIFGIKEPTAYMIREVVPNSPAQKAGLQEGDVIVEYNGKSILKDQRLEHLVNQTRPGSKASIGLYRNNNFAKIVRVNVVIEEVREINAASGVQKTTIVSPLGIEVKNFVDANGNAAGVHIISVNDNSPNADSIEPDSVIEIIFIPLNNGAFKAQPIPSVDVLQKVVALLKQAKISRVNCQVKIAEKRSLLKSLAIQ